MASLDDVDTPQSPGWYFKKLADELMRRRRHIQPLWDRYEGNPPLPDLGSPGANEGRAKVWKAFQRKARSNYAELIVAAALERLTAVGFRITSSDELAAAGPQGLGLSPRAAGPAVVAGADAKARRVWNGNEMPIASGDLTEWFLAMGASYGIVGPPEDDEPDLPVITAEDPRMVITAHDPVRSSKVLAGLKLYFDTELERDVAYLYRPGVAWRCERQGRKGISTLTNTSFRFNPKDWKVEDEVRLPAPLAKKVPMVRFRNRRGKGEFESVLDHLDRIDHMLLQRIVIATLQAFRQRAVKGVPRTDPKTGEAIDYDDIFTNDPGALWLLPATAEMWESGQVDLTPILSSVKDDVRDLAAVKRLPVQHFMPDAANQSAEGASAAREGLVYLCEDRQVRLGTGKSALMSLAFSYLEDAERSNPLAIETLWRPLERFSLTERATAAVAAQTAGVPWEARMTDFLQYEPDQVELLKAQRAEDLLYAPPVTPTPQRGLPAPAGATTQPEPRTAATSSTGTDEGAPASSTAPRTAPARSTTDDRAGTR